MPQKRNEQKNKTVDKLLKYFLSDFWARWQLVWNCRGDFVRIHASMSNFYLC